MPNEIIIMGVPHKIEYVDCVNKDELKAGEINFLDCVIRIDNSQPLEMQKVILLHEVLHGLCNLIGLNDLGENESAIQALAGGLYSTFKGSTIF